MKAKAKYTKEELDKLLVNHDLMRNASPSKEDDGSMIAHWEQVTGIKLKLQGKVFLCPKCEKWFSRKDLDGSHVVMADGGNRPQYITPLCQHCNRTRDDESFWVLKRHVVNTPQD